MDARSGWCEGCLRTIDEIAAWSRMDDLRKRAVLDHVSARRITALRASPVGGGPAAASTPPDLEPGSGAP